MPDPDDFKSTLDDLEKAMMQARGINQTSVPLAQPASVKTNVASPEIDQPDKTPTYQAAAKEDLPRIATLRARMESAAKNNNVPVEYLEGIASRETRAGKALPETGYGGKDGAMFGIMQVNSKVHELAGDSPDAQEHFDQAAGILHQNKIQMDKKFPKWSEQDRWRAAIAAYNTGAGHVNNPATADSQTDGHDYAKDVLIRAKTFKQQFSKRRR